MNNLKRYYVSLDLVSHFEGDIESDCEENAVYEFYLKINKDGLYNDCDIENEEVSTYYDY